MTRFQALALSALIALLSACATPADPQRETASPTPTTRAPGNNLPKVDWSAERVRITRALAGAGDLSVITRNDGNLQILIPGAEAFARDGVEPRASLRATLDRISGVLGETPGTEILVIGHTDGVGSELHNMQLSIRRAEAVVEYLRVRGIALTRLQADGRGETEPFADNGSEAGRAKNRRVEIIVRPFAR